MVSTGLLTVAEASAGFAMGDLPRAARWCGGIQAFVEGMGGADGRALTGAPGTVFGEGRGLPPAAAMEDGVAAASCGWRCRVAAGACAAGAAASLEDDIVGVAGPFPIFPSSFWWGGTQLMVFSEGPLCGAPGGPLGGGLIGGALAPEGLVSGPGGDFAPAGMEGVASCWPGVPRLKEEPPPPMEAAPTPPCIAPTAVAWESEL